MVHIHKDGREMRTGKAMMAALAIGALSLGVSAPAHAAEGDPGLGVTEESYTAFLRASDEPDAQETLQAFQSADERTQDEYIKHLNDPGFIKAALSQDSAQWEKYGLQATDVKTETPEARAAADTQHTHTYTKKMKWGPITTVTLSQTLTVTSNGKAVTRNEGCTAALGQYVPIATITNQTSHQVRNGHGYCRTDWKAEVAKVPNIVLSSVQEQEIDGAGGVVFERTYDI